MPINPPHTILGDNTEQQAYEILTDPGSEYESDGFLRINTMIDPICANFSNLPDHHICLIDFLYINAQHRTKARYRFERTPLSHQLVWIWQDSFKQPWYKYIKNPEIQNGCHYKIIEEFNDTQTAKSDEEALETKRDVVTRINQFCQLINIKTSHNNIAGVLQDIRKQSRSSDIGNVLGIRLYLYTPILTGILAIGSFFAVYYSSYQFALSIAFVSIFNIVLAICSQFEMNNIKLGPLSILTIRDYRINCLHNCFEVVRSCNLAMFLLSWILLDQLPNISQYLFLLVALSGITLIFLTQAKLTNNILFKANCLKSVEACELNKNAKALTAPLNPQALRVTTNEFDPLVVTTPEHQP